MSSVQANGAPSESQAAQHSPKVLKSQCGTLRFTVFGGIGSDTHEDMSNRVPAVGPKFNNSRGCSEFCSGKSTVQPWLLPASLLCFPLQSSSVGSQLLLCGSLRLTLLLTKGRWGTALGSRPLVLKQICCCPKSPRLSVLRLVLITEAGTAREASLEGPRLTLNAL